MAHRELLPTPYAIPGPAGAPSVSAHSVKQSATISAELSTTRAPRNLARFSTSQWATALAHASSPLRTSVALTRSLALRQDVRKTAVLVVRLDTFSHVGKDACATFADPTGEITATLHSTVLSAYSKVIQAGSVFVLKDVVALASLARRPTGFRPIRDCAVHISVHQSNIDRIFPEAEESSSDTEQGTPRSARPRHNRTEPLSSVELLDAYSSEAREPPNSVRSRPQSAPFGLSDRASTYNSRMSGIAPGRPSHRHHEQSRKRPMPRMPANPSTGSKFPRNGEPTTRPRVSNPVPPRVSSMDVNRHRQVSHSVAPLESEANDDVLDELLGGVDIEAAIAASNHAHVSLSTADRNGSNSCAADPSLTSAKPQVNITTGAEVERSKTLGNERDSELATPGSRAMLEGSREPPSKKLSCGASASPHEPKTADDNLLDALMNDMEGESDSPSTRPSSKDPVARAETETNRTNQNEVPANGMDDSVLDGLMAGLDGDDFGDI